jgi:3'-phosphoadenosine 5'-phosphosulfate (PAPS) 3'-phosphatase
MAIVGAGAYKLVNDRAWKLAIDADDRWPPRARFIDSTPPTGAIADLMARHDGQFVECGSIGLKICRVADGSADVFMKSLRFKTWDTAPGDLILSEAGGRLGTWDGAPVDYASCEVAFSGLLAAPSDLFSRVIEEVGEHDPHRPRL